jgi:hypothetical protein
MSVAVITGHSYRDYWARIGDAKPLAEKAIAMFGVRDLWPEAESERLERATPSAEDATLRNRLERARPPPHPKPRRAPSCRVRRLASSPNDATCQRSARAASAVGH